MTGIEIYIAAGVWIGLSTMLGYAMYKLGHDNGKLTENKRWIEEVQTSSAHEALKAANKTAEQLDSHMESVVNGVKLAVDKELSEVREDRYNQKVTTDENFVALSNAIVEQSDLMAEVLEDYGTKLDSVIAWSEEVNDSVDKIYARFEKFEKEVRSELDNLEWVEEEVTDDFEGRSTQHQFGEQMSHTPSPSTNGETHGTPLPSNREAPESAPQNPSPAQGTHLTPDDLEPDVAPLIEARNDANGTNEDAPMITDLRAEPFKEAPSSMAGPDPNYRIPPTVAGVSEMDTGRTSASDFSSNPFRRMSK
jgi:adenylate kinase family enzyme